MRYQGSKRRIAKDIAAIVESSIKANDVYIEPFIGGANSFSVINHKNKAGYDINEDIIALWNAVKDGTFEAPIAVTKERYYDIKESAKNRDGRYPQDLIGYVSHCCSNGCGYFSGYANYNPRRKEDHIKEAAHSFNKQVSKFKNLQSSTFTQSSYKDIDVPKNALVYCDPPYANTKKYSCDFDNDEFWDWCREKASTGAKILVSEYSAPSDFVCIWEKKVKDGMSNKLIDGKQGIKTEKLFVHKSQKKLFVCPK